MPMADNFFSMNRMKSHDENRQFYCCDVIVDMKDQGQDWCHIPEDSISLHNRKLVANCTASLNKV